MHITPNIPDVGKSHFGFVVTKRGGDKHAEQGTWMHEDVALEFARWLSPEFAIWCNDRIKELLTMGMTATPLVSIRGMPCLFAVVKGFKIAI